MVIIEKNLNVLTLPNSMVKIIEKNLNEKMYNVAKFYG